MIDAEDDINNPAVNAEELSAISETDKQGEGKQGGRTGSGSGGGVRLPPNMLKEVTSNWQFLDAANAAVRLAEFFGEGVARASAHIQVSWANLHNHGFAIIHQAIEFAKDVARLLMNPTRDNIEILKHRYGVHVTTGPSG